jgi:hypothetical protein
MRVLFEALSSSLALQRGIYVRESAKQAAQQRQRRNLETAKQAVHSMEVSLFHVTIFGVVISVLQLSVGVFGHRRHVEISTPTLHSL